LAFGLRNVLGGQINRLKLWRCTCTEKQRQDYCGSIHFVTPMWETDAKVGISPHTDSESMSNQMHWQEAIAIFERPTSTPPAPPASP
jgi:phage gp36-like protein